MTKNNPLKHWHNTDFLQIKERYVANQQAIDDDKPTLQMEQGKNGLFLWNTDWVTQN